MDGRPHITSALGADIVLFRNTAFDRHRISVKVVVETGNRRTADVRWYMQFVRIHNTECEAGGGILNLDVNAY